MNGGALIWRFFETKGFGKSFVIIRRVAEGVALARGAAGINVEQLGGCIANLLSGFAPRFFPLARA
jgi:hypothetical protein